MFIHSDRNLQIYLGFLTPHHSIDSAHATGFTQQAFRFPHAERRTPTSFEVKVDHWICLLFRFV